MPAPLPDWFVELAATVRQWGRWGEADELGTLNLIDDAAVRRGAACVRTGRRRSLALPFGAASPQMGTIPGRINPLRTMVAINVPYLGDVANFCASDDTVTMGLQASTHWDGLAHVSYDGLLYNGFPAASVTADRGATRLGIHQVRTLTSRGVLLDIAAARGVERLEGATAVTADDLDAAVEHGRLIVEPGDVALIRTGHVQVFRGGDRRAYTTGPQPGLGTSCAAWFKAKDVAAVAIDTLALDVFPGEDPAVLFPAHLLHLRDMGLTQGQNFDFEGLAEDCAEARDWTCLLEASPIGFHGGVGAPVNPVAIT